MKSVLSKLALGALGLVAVSVVVGTAWSRSYWGYWFSPPGNELPVRDFAALHVFAEVEAAGPAPSLDWRFSRLSQEQIAEGAQWYRRSPIDAFWYRLHAAVDEANLLPAERDLPLEEILRSVEKEVSVSELLVEGDPGYESTRQLGGYAAIGSTRSGEIRVALALSGGQASNDHHPVFDFEFSCREKVCTELHAVRYFEDVAGIEHLRWQWGALAALIVGVALTVVVSVLWFSTRGAIRLLRARRARSA
jgi:hypothetical protein